jgi:Papain family cysteine protease
MDYAFEWVIQNGGISTETNYPYTAKDGICNITRVIEQETIGNLSFSDVVLNVFNWYRAFPLCELWLHLLVEFVEVTCSFLFPFCLWVQHWK